MKHTKRVIFMVLPLLFVPLVYSISSTRDACAVPPDSEWGSRGTCDCHDANCDRMTCCWAEDDLNNPGEFIVWCQTCDTPDPGAPADCDPIFSRTKSPTGPFTPPQGDVEQPPTNTPPLFGENTNVPPTGGIEQPPTTTTPPQDDNQGGGLPPIKNQENVPPGGDVAEQPEDDGQEDSSEGAETAGPLT